LTQLHAKIYLPTTCLEESPS